MSLILTAALQLGDPTGRVFTPLHFGANVEFFRQYSWAGVTRRQAGFSRALEASGVRALRFPGGNPAYF